MYYNNMGTGGKPATTTNEQLVVEYLPLRFVTYEYSTGGVYRQEHLVSCPVITDRNQNGRVLTTDL